MVQTKSAKKGWGPAASDPETEKKPEEQMAGEAAEVEEEEHGATTVTKPHEMVSEVSAEPAWESAADQAPSTNGSTNGYHYQAEHDIEEVGAEDEEVGDEEVGDEEVGGQETVRPAVESEHKPDYESGEEPIHSSDSGNPATPEPEGYSDPAPASFRENAPETTEDDRNSHGNHEAPVAAAQKEQDRSELSSQGDAQFPQGPLQESVPPERETPEPGPTSDSDGASYSGQPANEVSATFSRLPFIGKLLRKSRKRDFSIPRSQPNEQPASAPSGASAGPEDRPGTAPQVAKPSPEEIERRLKLALRETSVKGFSRLCVGSPKGGVGKSSVSYAIAGAFAYYTNLRVCLVDADPEFGSARMLVPRPVEYSVVEMARDADELHKLSDIRPYVSQNERMRLDVLLNPVEMATKAAVGDLGAAYERVDTVLSRFYDVVIYDMGLGFSHPQIQKVLSLSDELLLVGDSEVIPNAMLSDALSYLNSLRVDLSHATLAVNHRLPPTDESAVTGPVKGGYAGQLRRVTEVPYDAKLSQLLNRRSFHIEELNLDTRLGILTTATACLEGLRRDIFEGGKVVNTDLSGRTRKDTTQAERTR